MPIKYDSILYITGRGGSLNSGLAKYLATISENFDGLALDVPFLRQELMDQIEQIADKLREHTDRTVIANSYGAYLTLQAMIDLDVTLKRVILLSPVLRTAQAKDRMYLSRPPLTKRLREAMEQDRLVRPLEFNIYIGDQDELYHPELEGRFNQYYGAGTFHVLNGGGHMLSQDCVPEILGIRSR